MSDYKAQFNKVASRLKGALSHTFSAVALSKPGQTFITNAGRIGGLAYFAGDVNLGIQYMLPAASFLLSDIFYAISDFKGKNSLNITPESSMKNTLYKSINKIAPQGIRLSGWSFLFGTTALAGLTSDVDNYAPLALSYLAMGAHALTFVFEEKFHKLSEKVSESKSKILSNVFSPLAKYPMLSMATIGLAGKAAMAYGAIQNNDMNMLTTAAIWAIGDASCICKDQNVLKWIDGVKNKRTPMPS